MFTWIKRLTSQMERSSTSVWIVPSKSYEGIILSSRQTGKRLGTKSEVTLLIQVMPANDRNYIAIHHGYFGDEAYKDNMQSGQRVKVIYPNIFSKKLQLQFMSETEEAGR